MLQFNQKYIEEHNRVELTDCAAIKLLRSRFFFLLETNAVRHAASPDDNEPFNQIRSESAENAQTLKIQ